MLDATPYDMLTSTSGLPNFTLTVNDAEQTKKMWVTDSITDTQIDPEFCGKRSYSLSVNADQTTDS